MAASMAPGTGTTQLVASTARVATASRRCPASDSGR